jgi:serine/threonine protein phosphatase PrpC
MRLICAGLTDVGMAREHNEDSFYLSQDEALCIVADGMGGHRSGEVASRMAVEQIVAFYQETQGGKDLDEDFSIWPFRRKRPEHREEKRLLASVTRANRVINTEAKNNEDYRGMGTTIVGMYFLEEGLYTAHVGDSRAYRLRDGALEQLTEDHSLANEYVRMGILKKSDIGHFPYKNVITRAVGLAETVEVETRFYQHQPNDIYILCSDGLSDPLRDEDIARIITAANGDLEAACRELITEANRNGGPDNITAVLAQTLA